MEYNIDLDKAVNDFCREYDIYPTKDEKLILKLAINKGILLSVQEEIKRWTDKLEEI